MTQKTRALVVIDLQNEFLSDSGRYSIQPTSKESLLCKLHDLVPIFRANGGHIIWVKAVYTNSLAQSSQHETFVASCSSRDVFLTGTHKGRFPCCEVGSQNAEFHPRVSAMIEEKDTILTKTWYSAFKETALLETLSHFETKEVFFCGLLTNTCVHATVIDASTVEGLKIHIITDCLGWRREESHLRALEKMVELGAVAVQSSFFVGGPHLDRNIREDTTSGQPVPEDAISIPKLYFVNGSIPSWRVQMALFEKGIEFQQIKMKVMTHPKPTRLPEFLALNPRGKTPVFVDKDEDRTAVNESLAILLYLETYYTDTKTLLPPLKQRKHRARVLSLIQETENLHNAYDTLEEAFFSNRHIVNDDFVMYIRPPLLTALFTELEFWETYASNSVRFISGGEEFTLADCAFYPILGYMVRRGFRLDEPMWPGLKRYYEAVWDMESGAARKAQPEGWHGRGKADVFRGT